MRKQLIVLVLISLVFWGFWGGAKDSIPQPPIPAPFMVGDSPWADSLIQTMSLDQKIGQLFMVAANSRDSDSAYYAQIDHLIEDYGIGGLIYFQSGPHAHNRLVNRFQSKSVLPLLNGIDGEWGLSMRIDSMQTYPWNMTLGAIQDDALLYQMGQTLARECKTMGIHFNFAPVVDVNSNPLNPIINARSYGENPQRVSDKGLALMQGMQDAGVLACAKHFPGHGDTDSDSHKTLPVITHSRARIDSIDLVPFKRLVDAGVGSVMIAHLNIPALDSTQDRACTLAPYVVDTMLKQEMNFSGLAITDALNMKGVSAYYKSGDLEVQALRAGNDVLLFPEDVPAAVSAIKQAIKDSTLNETRINEACYKILRAKAWLGITDSAFVDTTKVLLQAQPKDVKLLIHDMHAAALTLLKNEQEILPIKTLKNKKLAVLTLGSAHSDVFVKQLKRYADVHLFDPTLDEPSDFDQLIVSVHMSNASPWKSYRISEQDRNTIASYAKQTSVSLVVFANPYSLLQADYLTDVKSVLMAYQNAPSMQSVAAQSIFGALPITGKLPVSISTNFPEGIGLSTKSISRLEYAFPEAVSLNSDTLALIDSIAHYAISIKATPGCQVLVAKEGKVVYNKSFGYQTYDSIQQVEEFHLYDIASITKIASTLPIIMQKVDDNSYHIDKPLKKIIQIADTCSKARLTTRKMLAHHAQLWPWIPFYRETLNENGDLDPSIYSTSKQGDYTIQVAENLFMNATYEDTLRDRVLYSKMRKQKGYKYSDLPYYILKDILEEQEKVSLKDMIQERIFKDLGANYTTYLPREKFSLSHIVPTEEDGYFRKQLLRGFVHDPGAAMQNGIGGHAGLFSNANDLAKLMQMYLNGGVYGGQRFIKESTLEEFSACQYCRKDNRRGVGFDRPVMDGSPGPTCDLVSEQSFGHSGFTGTIAWADPEHDLIYVFLSNRIHPSADNTLLVKEDIRTRIQEVIYKAIE